MQDDKLLTQYARDGSEAAFRQLLARHMTLVYRTCLRETGSASQAEDASQVVILLLAREAPSLRAGPSLAGWLYKTSLFVAKDIRKQETRRTRREEAVMQEAVHAQAAPAPEWDTVEPPLNAALASLKPAEREAVLLRFFEGRTLAETGTALNISEDAARMRVARALDKLRRYLTAHGVAVTGVVLAALLTAEATRSVSAEAASTVTQGTLYAITNGPALNVFLLSKGVSHTMKVLKIKYAALVVGLLLVGAAVAPLVHAISPDKASMSVHQISPQPTLADFYTDRQPPVLETLIMPDTRGGQSGMAGGTPHGEGNMRIATYTSPSSFTTVCQFYTGKLLPPGAKPQALGVQGDLGKQCGYSIEERQGTSAATFSQRTSAYTISVSVVRGATNKATAVTLIYGLN